MTVQPVPERITLHLPREVRDGRSNEVPDRIIFGRHRSAEVEEEDIAVHVGFCDEGDHGARRVEKARPCREGEAVGRYFHDLNPGRSPGGSTRVG